MQTSILVFMTCLLYEENPVGFYDKFTFCWQPSWSTYHFYFLWKILLISMTCLLSVDNYLGLHDMFTFWEESCWLLRNVYFLTRFQQVSMICLCYADNHLRPWHVYFIRRVLLTLCRQPCWSPCHVYFLQVPLYATVLCTEEAADFTEGPDAEITLENFASLQVS